MAKKKWKFTDLSDDDISQENKIETNENNLEKNKFDLNINDFSEKKENNNDIVEQKNEIKSIDKNVNIEVIKNDNIPKIINDNVENKILNNEKKDEKVATDEYKSKYDLNIDYDSDIPIKQQIKEQQTNISSNSQTKLKTFNESLNENTKIIDQEFNSSKIQQFFTTKEKLDVKTNIYLKPNLVNEIQVLSKKTGESRSAIINKLIEHALKDIKSN